MNIDKKKPQKIISFTELKDTNGEKVKKLLDEYDLIISLEGVFFFRLSPCFFK